MRPTESSNRRVYHAAMSPSPAGALSLQGLVAGLADPEWAEEWITDGVSPLTVVDLDGGSVDEVPGAAAHPLAGDSRGGRPSPAGGSPRGLRRPSVPTGRAGGRGLGRCRRSRRGPRRGD